MDNLNIKINSIVLEDVSSYYEGRWEALRKKIASQLHNAVGQDITSIQLATQLLRRQLLNTEPFIIELLDDTCSNLEKLSHTVRSINYDLYPTMLDHIGLKPALENLIRQSPLFKGGKLSHFIDSVSCKGEKSLIIYRVIEEIIDVCLNDMKADHISISIKSNQNIISTHIDFINAFIDSEKEHLCCIRLKHIKNLLQKLNSGFQLKENSSGNYEIFAEILADEELPDENTYN